MEINVVKRFSAVDLFSGCGGLTLGLKWAGFNVIGAVESDLLAVETYLKNHPEVKVWHQDIITLSGKQILKALGLKRGELDLLAGCPPCQGFSRIRTKNGRKKVFDKRNDLVLECIRLLKAIFPKIFLMENVPGLAKDKRMKIFKKVAQDLGYDINGTPLILDTENFGLPQRRKRMIFICSRVGPIILPRPSRLQGTVKKAIGWLPAPGQKKDPLHDYKEKRSSQILARIKRIPKNGGSRANLPKKHQLKCHNKTSIGFKDVYGRMAWDEVSPTITCGCINPSKGRFLHPSQNRAITLREAAILQTFPKSYFFPLRRGKFATAALIGNALPPAFVKKHANAIKRTLLSS